MGWGGGRGRAARCLITEFELGGGQGVRFTVMTEWPEFTVRPEVKGAGEGLRAASSLSLS